MSENTVELIGVYGSDTTHALSAWTSTARDLTKGKEARIGSLVEMLWEEGHHTPFEKSTLHFLVKTDIATHIHLLKHRIGVSINAESARYKELKDPVDGEDRVYIPDDWPEGLAGLLSAHSSAGTFLYKMALTTLVEEHGFSRARAKESARFFLGYSNQVVADISFNFRSFGHFQKLRNSPHAQKEIRWIAEEMLRLVDEEGSFPHSVAALRKGGLGDFNE